MIATRRNERGLRAEFLLQFKTQDAAVKFQRAFEVGDFQMNVADADAGINRPGNRFFFHSGRLNQIPPERESTQTKAAAETTGTRSGAGKMTFVAAFAVAIHFALGRTRSATRLRAATLRT